MTTIRVLASVLSAGLSLGSLECGGKVLADTQTLGAHSVSDGSTADLSSVVGAGWELRVDRVWNRELPTGSIGDSLPESSYAPTPNGNRYSVDFSADGRAVTVSEKMKGQASGTSTTKRAYRLDEGTFAGGFFVVWSSDGRLQGELTMNGSGVPVISSERGELVKRQ